MAVAAPQGSLGNSVPVAIPLGATTVNNVSPINVSVYQSYPDSPARAGRT
jgi:hypothetical protein